jgi:hypothetical protein
MECNCVHEKVCGIRNRVHNAVSEMFEMRFGGPQPEWVKIESAIQAVCRFRSAKSAASQPPASTNTGSPKLLGELEDCRYILQSRLVHRYDEVVERLRAVIAQLRAL